ncbi:ANR family transcriptional regulator [Aggregatibacter actinomycetemcomitans]|uniref:ANR family transcriptional regulator n=1 Tax=Aggregatibacter actinomycetemcomitans TaxID=714 RepID=UPI00197B2E54|nr:ANR family transcriptional regulator [Aggregatibacter actinomycetemcomitans]MBN6060451.1 ANR family transcriptional regulator [Aggregatibacter actinomycetemcomitans]MBN6089003.1 ANR family transcriptional regulator [Aggregatibacter actinomycetemcomitans]
MSNERREIYHKLSSEAAELERAGEYARAYSGWLKACLATNKSDEHNWCSARAQHCQKKANTRH